MQHVVYYEPDYDTTHPNLWDLRGHYKYPSILGSLREHARITIVMHRVPPPDDPYRKVLEHDYGVHFERLRWANTPGPRRGERLAARLSRSLAKLAPTVISNLNGRSIVYCYASALAAAELGVRYVMRIGGDDLSTKAHVYSKSDQAFLGTEAYFDLVRQERLVADMADAIIVMTRRERARLATIAAVPSKIAVCYRGVDPALFSSAQSREGRCRRFLFVGRRSAEKGYDLAETAARQLHAEGCDIQFTFAGTFEPGIIDNRHYVGYVSYADLPALYANHDAVIMCSRTEGFPQVLMEAMSMGLPCIMSRHLFSLDFSDRSTALFCDCEANDLALKIRQLCEDPLLYANLSERSLAYARSEFAQDALGQHYQQILLGG